MKIHSLQIILDKKVYYSGDYLTGKVVVKPSCGSWPSKAFVFIKLYNELEIDWHERGLTDYHGKQTYTYIKRPFNLSQSVLFGKRHVVSVVNDDQKEFTFIYPFVFQLPTRLQSSITIKHAKCQYFIKAFLTTDAQIADEYYKHDIDINRDEFKSLSHQHTCKQEVQIRNETYTPSLDNGQHVFEDASSHIKVKITLPKLVYRNSELIPIHVLIWPVDVGHYNEKHHFNVHKICFKLIERARLYAISPQRHIKSIEHTIEHLNRRYLHENAPSNGHSIILDEFFEIPATLYSSSCKTITIDEQNPIKIDYKLCLEFWKSFLSVDLNVSIPLEIDPENF